MPVLILSESVSINVEHKMANPGNKTNIMIVGVWREVRVGNTRCGELFIEIEYWPG